MKVCTVKQLDPGNQTVTAFFSKFANLISHREVKGKNLTLKLCSSKICILSGSFSFYYHNNHTLLSKQPQRGTFSAPRANILVLALYNGIRANYNHQMTNC